MILFRTSPDSDFIFIGTGLASFTPFCIPRHQNSDLSQHSILGAYLGRLKGSVSYGNGSGRHVTSSYSARNLRRSSTRNLRRRSTSIPSSPSLCPPVRWHTTSIPSEPRCMSLVRGCTVGKGGRHVLLGQGSRRIVTLLSGISFSFHKVVSPIH
jgi:hypothetical protein